MSRSLPPHICVLTAYRYVWQSIEASGLKVIPFAEMVVLPSGVTFQTHLNIAFPSASKPAKLEVTNDRGTYTVSIKPQLGELLRPTTLAEPEFDSRQSSHPEEGKQRETGATHVLLFSRASHDRGAQRHARIFGAPDPAARASWRREQPGQQNA